MRSAVNSSAPAPPVGGAAEASLAGGGRQTPDRGPGGARGSAVGPTPSLPPSPLSAACWFSWSWPTWSSRPPVPLSRSSGRRAYPSSPAPIGIPIKGQFGALAFIYGTIVTSAIALIIAVPLSIGVALFSTEYAPKRAARPPHLRGGSARGRPQRHLRLVGSLRPASALSAAGGRLPCQVPGLDPHLQGAGVRAFHTSGQASFSPS